VNDEQVLREVGILVDAPPPAGPHDLSENIYAEPNWKRIAGWLGSAALVSMTLLLWLIDEVARRS
jgi:hypothetical protein